MGPLDILVQRGELTEALARQISEKVQNEGVTLESALLEHGLPDVVVRDLFADYYEVPGFILPEGFSITEEVLHFVPEESAIHYKIAPLFVEDGVLVVGASDPESLQVREVLNFVSTKFDLGFRLVFMLESDIKKAQQFYANLKGEVTDVLSTLEGELNAEIAVGTEAASAEDKKVMEHIEEDAPVTKIVATILRYAVDGNASDIHIEPNNKKIAVRFRVDGDLVTSLELPINVHLAVVARVKILSSMRLDEKRKPQDGRFSATFDGRKIDFRVSVLPTSHGEKVVMRILDTDHGVRSLDGVGVSPHILEVIRKAIKEPHGIILISGPTGSGKSTTLYAMMAEIDRQSKNVLSLEDPVEYDMEGVSQSQVRPEIGYTFASGLRAALRQDPDIIMVGEIRDKETAQLAIQAALTGHLVLSTIHTNNAIGVVPRLIDMGVDPYLIAPTLKLALAQRLAKRLCPGAGKEEPLSESTKLMMQETFKTLPEKFHGRIPKNKTMVRPESTPSCATGLKGRVAVMEALEISDEVQSLILKNVTEEEVLLAARKQGFMTMQEDAIIKALDHVIPFEEMSAFGSKLGTDSLLEDVSATVDNPATVIAIPAIINLNEDTIS
jgi:type IV pilus assembly protein PilB